MPLRILVIDDDPQITGMMGKFLGGEGHQATLISDPSTISPALKKEEWDLILCDMYLGSTTGVDVLKEAAKVRGGTPFVIMTAHGTMDVAMDSIRGGAFDFIGKPVDFEQLRQILRRAAELRKELPEVTINTPSGSGMLIGRAPAMAEVYKLIAKATAVDSPVLITGESGTGKELVARSLHTYSARKAKKFVPVNCPAIPEHLLESEFFGHIRGAFTGAVADNVGLFREADGGTLFLDEIADLPLPLQSKLLRVLEDSQVRPVGSDKFYKVDVRFIAATNRPLAAMVKEGTFREDLYYRINGVQIRVPALRERKEDIELLAAHYISLLSQKNKREIILTQAASDALKQYSWPGNVRELVRELERASTMSSTGVLTAQDFATLGIGAEEKETELKSLDDMEKAHILSILRHVGGNKQKAAEILKIDRKTLQRKLQQYNADPGGESE
jgi:DNA-binding NtrC family response regulator